MGLSMMAVAGLAAAEANMILVVFLAIFLIFFQLTWGTYAWVYLPMVNCDEGLSIGSLVLWAGALVLTIYTNTMFTELGQPATFCIFGSINLASFVFFFFFLREIKGLSRDEAQKLYSKADMDDAEKYRRDSINSFKRPRPQSIQGQKDEKKHIMADDNTEDASVSPESLID